MTICQKIAFGTVLAPSLYDINKNKMSDQQPKKTCLGVIAKLFHIKKKKTFLEVIKEAEHLLKWDRQIEKHRISIERLIALQIQHMVLIMAALFYLFTSFWKDTQKMCCTTDPCTPWLYAHVAAFVSFACLCVGCWHLLQAYYRGVVPSKKIQHYQQLSSMKKMKDYYDKEPKKFLSVLTDRLVEAITIGKKINDKQVSKLYKCKGFFTYSYISLAVYAGFFMYFLNYRFP